MFFRAERTGATKKNLQLAVRVPVGVLDVDGLLDVVVLEGVEGLVGEAEQALLVLAAVVDLGDVPAADHLLVVGEGGEVSDGGLGLSGLVDAVSLLADSVASGEPLLEGSLAGLPVDVVGLEDGVGLTNGSEEIDVSAADVHVLRGVLEAVSVG